MEQPELLKNQVANPIQKKKHGGPRPGAGRPKGALSQETVRINQAKASLREMAAEHAPMAIQTLASIASSSPSDQAKVAAIKELLDRAYGKAPQAIVGDPDNPIDVRHSVIEVVIRDAQS